MTSTVAFDWKMQYIAVYYFQISSIVVENVTFCVKGRRDPLTIILLSVVQFVLCPYRNYWSDELGLVL